MSFRKLTLAALVSSASFLPISAIAQDSPGSGPNPYRDCGIGAAIFTNTGWAAATSNVIWDLGITAITSATSSPETCNAKNVEAAMFIHETLDNLVEETARGEDTHLASVLSIYSCPAEMNAAVVDGIRPIVAGQVTAEGYSALPRQERASQFYNTVTGHLRTQYNGSCSS